MSCSVVRLAALFLLSLLIADRAAAATECQEVTDCEQHETCFIGKCEDLRLLCSSPRYCGPHATCVVRHHNATCLCKPGFSTTEDWPCLQETIAPIPHVEYNKSEELSVEMKGIAQITFFSHGMTFTIQTLDLGIEIRKLHCFITPGETYRVTVSLEGEKSTGSNMITSINMTTRSNMTLTHSGQTDSGWFDFPVSTDKNQVYLLPNSEYKVTVGYEGSFYYRRQESPQINLEHFVLKDLPNCYTDQYCTPMIYVGYKTLTPL